MKCTTAGCDSASVSKGMCRRCYHKAWSAKNAEKVAADKRAWYEQNHTVSIERARQWRKNNPGAASRRRRTRLREVLVNDFTSEQWQSLLVEFDFCCAYCQARDVPLEQEHMTPLSRGGNHTRSNIVPACGDCNRRKGVRTLLEATTLLGNSVRAIAERGWAKREQTA